MLRSLNICTKCRLSLMQRTGPEEWLRTQEHIVRRHRHKSRSSDKSLWNLILDDIQPFSKSQPRTRHPAQQQPNHFTGPQGESSSSRSVSHDEKSEYLPFSHKKAHVPDISPSEVISHFEDNVYFWATAERTKQRLTSFGIPATDTRKLLNGFVEDVEAGLLSDPENHAYYNLQRFSHPHDSTSVDVIYSTIFFSWAAKPENKMELEEELGVDPQTTHFMQRLVNATSRPYPADEFPKARAMHRKVIMHVGPTNSGKTHHALRALAAAKTGVYAGPLRLLAHEIWHRLNTGQIIPLGVEEGPTDNAVPEGDPKYVRLCNMVTGEEQRIMGVDVPLRSCTIEMMSFVNHYDVAVIDEIQMIGDRTRGGGWMNALLGVCAKEVHLCGEETVVPVVQALLRHTGDEVEVRRYERLTPLVVEDKSLNADLTNVREGDCIVSFSRSKIFDLKKLVEAKTGMRCAVVYGRLPPEVRSEQAALFNDPNSGYDVLIGSDAIGMGLNLKIKRIIFEAMTKFDDGGQRSLSTSSIKQIAGRAGRYGLHDSQIDLGGTATTLYPEDLSNLAHWIAAPYEPLPFTLIGHSSSLLDATLSILPPGSSMNLALLAPKYIGRLPPFVRYATHDHLNHIGSFIDNEWSHMSNDDKVLLLYAPIPWKDVETVNIIKRMLIIHARDFTVDIETVIKGQGFLETMEYVEDMMKNQGKERSTFSSSPSTLMLLESFHKVLVFYIWMNFRNPIVYSDNFVHELKERSEKVLNWTLESISKLSKRPIAAAIPPPLTVGDVKPLAKKSILKIKNDLWEERMPYETMGASHNDINLLPLQ